MTLKLTIEQKIFIVLIVLAGLISGYIMFFPSEKKDNNVSVQKETSSKDIDSDSDSFNRSLSPSETRDKINKIENELSELKEKLHELNKKLDEENEMIDEMKIALKEKTTINIFNNNAWYDIISIYETYSQKESDISFLKNSLEEKNKDNKELNKQISDIQEKIKLLEQQEKSLKEALAQFIKTNPSVDFSFIDSEIEMENIDRIKKDKIDSFMKENQIDPTTLVGEDISVYPTNVKGMIVRNLPPFIMPTHGTITSNFGYRIHPIFKTEKYHSGTDIGVDYGTPIKASNYGLVVYSGWYGGFGNTIILSHAEGVYTLYGHNSELKVNEGEIVRQGQIIALAGSTGYSTGPHCHFSMWINNALVDPLENVNDLN